MKIKFHETIYDMMSVPNVNATHFQASFEKGDNTFDFIANDTLNTTKITVYNDEGETEGIYTGYSTRIALYLLGGNSTLSAEFENADIQAQIDALTQSVSTATQTVSELNDRVDELTPYTDTKTAYFGETEKTFYDVPEGNVSVFFDNYNGNYSINRQEDRLIVSFDALENETNITISIQ